MFKQWSIQKLLSLWTMLAAMSLIFMTLIVFYSNQYFGKAYHQLVQNVMPLSESARKLTALTAELIARQHILIHSSPHVFIDVLPSQASLEAQFVEQWDILQGLTKTNSAVAEQAQALQARYYDFLLLEQSVTDLLLERDSLERARVSCELDFLCIHNLAQQQEANRSKLAIVLTDSLRDVDILRVETNQFAADVHVLISQTLSKPHLVSQITRVLLILGFVFLILVMVYFVRVITHRIHQSLKGLRTSMHALSKENFSTRMPVQSGDSEFALLAHDFNLFAENTEKLFQALQQTKHTVQLRERHISAIINGVPEAILTLDVQGVISDSNPAAEQIFNAPQKAFIGRNLMDFLVTPLVTTLEKIVSSKNDRREYEFTPIGSESISVLISLKQIAESSTSTWVCVMTDISSWQQAQNQLQRTSNELNAIFENAMMGIAFVKDRQMIRVNQKLIELFAAERDQLEGHSTRQLYLSNEAFKRFGEHAAHVLNVGGSYDGQVEMQRLNGERFWCALAGKAINPMLPDEGTIWLFEDVTTQRINEERLTRLASIDSLTGLLNRNVFNDRLEHAIHKAQRNQARIAVFFIDLDHFKHINDSLGHKAGDALLCEVAKRIRAGMRESDTVARLGGDEFTVILEDISSAQYVGHVAEKILSSITLPFMIDNVEINVSPSIGISLYPADGRDADLLIRNADAAMYHAKNNGRNNFQFYSAEMNAEASQRLLLETNLRRAVEQNEFYLMYQPQIDLNTGKIIGAEVLLRWTSELLGEISPVRFIPVLEETGLISTVGEWVLRETCNIFMSNRDRFPEDFVLAVNLSSRQFKGRRLTHIIRDLLVQTQMPGKNLELEITESLLMDNTEIAIEILRELGDLEITMAIDDFGTGYSSLSYLKQFPLNVLKVDRTFVRDITTDNDDAAIVGAIIAMAESLSLDIVAEGVETAEQLALLKEKGCGRAQGFYFSKPLLLKDLMSFIAQPPSFPDFDK